MTDPYYAPRSSDTVLECPHCGRIVPAWNVAELSNAAKRGRHTVEIKTGVVLSCQGCGEVYCIGQAGPFKRHPNALPRLGPGPPPPQAPAEEPEGFVPPPNPRQRPPV